METVKKGIILETLNNVNVLEAKRGSDGLIRLEGTFGVCGVRNNNGRIYETKNYQAMVTEMQKRIQSQGVMGELEHPSTMNITLENVSHKIERIDIDESGKVTGTIVLLNTPKGQIAQSIVEAGLPLFISSRARGTVSQDGKVKLEDLATYDLVGTPGFSQARLDLAKGQTFECLNESLAVIYDVDDKSNVVENKEINYNTNKIKESKMSSKFDNYHLDMLIEKYNELDKEIGDLRKLINDVAVDHAINESENIASTPAYTGITMQEVKEYIQECVAPAIQNWIVEEYSPEVQNWIVEEYSPEVQNWIVEDVAPEIQNWIVEDYSPEIQNWIVEEYTPMVDSWVAEELKPDFEDTIKESLSDTKANKLSSIDQVLNLLETRKDTKSDNKMITETKEDKFANEYIVKHMPEEYAPHWNLASDVVKESLVSKSRLYDFSKDGVLESFWEKADFTEPIAQVNEGKQKTISFGGEDYIRRSLRATGARLGLRD